ncbi:O-antigen ligase family protein [Desulfosediminicola sp.]|uniref:O-antigen ligase family protein n=1 Tax=Desulfosediminicola sp. TaxID=2886825 RepID=UPI003AF2FE94
MKKRSLERIDYFYFFVVVIYAAMAVPATKSMVRPWNGGVIEYLIPWGTTIFMVLRHRIRFDNVILLKVIGIYMFWVLLQTIKIDQFYDGSILFLLNIIISYILIKIYGVTMFSLYEKIVTHLSVVAIIGWVLQVIIPGSFTEVMKATSIHDFPSYNTIIANNIFFSLSSYHQYGGYEYFLPRNSGFSWEPGRYAAMVVFALYFNLMKQSRKAKDILSFWVLFLALLTTQSTTGYAALVVLLVYFLKKYKNPIIKILSSYVVFIPLLVVIIVAPFMLEKISAGLSVESELARLTEIAQNRTQGDRVVVPQRFVSLYLNWMNIKESPILGYGIDSANSFVKTQISPFLSPTGGSLRIFAQFGLLLGAIVYFQLYKSSVFFSKYYKYKGNWCFFFVFSVLSVSYSFWMVPIYMSLWMFTLFYNKNDILKDYAC